MSYIIPTLYSGCSFPLLHLSEDKSPTILWLKPWTAAPQLYRVDIRTVMWTSVLGPLLRTELSFQMPVSTWARLEILEI